MSEEELVRRAAGGDMDALTELLHQFGAQVRRELKINKCWQNVLEPDDVMQVTYLEAFLRMRSLRPDGPAAFLGWLRRIAANNLRDAIKELARRKRPPPHRRIEVFVGDDSVVALFELLGAGSTTPSRQIAEKEVHAALENALARLPSDYATAVRLYDLEGRRIAEVAQRMGRSEGAVHMLRARAHERLKEVLAPYAQPRSGTG